MGSRSDKRVLNWPKADRVLLSIPIELKLVSVAAKLVSRIAVFNDSPFSGERGVLCAEDRTDMKLLMRDSSLVYVVMAAELFGAKCTMRCRFVPGETI